MNRALLEETVQHADSVLPIPLAKTVLPKALIIDLSEQTSSFVEVSQVFLNKYIGGPALAARLWASFAGSEVDFPDNHEADNPIVITGDGMGSLVTVAFRSPVTGNLSFNTFSAKFNINCCAVVFLGRLARTGIVSFSAGELRFEYASDLIHASAVRLNELIPGCIATGDAATNRLLYASALYNDAVTGRGGLGYVMAEKNLKALSVELLPTVRDTFDFSTFVKNASLMGWAPVDNITKRTDPRLFHLCTAEKKRKIGDVFIPCQAVLMLGSNLGCYDIAKVYERYKLCLEYAVDPVSFGNVLGWIREAQERGIIAFDRELDFNDNNVILKFMKMIVFRDGSASIFADGTKAAAVFFGNDKFSKEINGLECGPYDYRGSQASALSDALGNWFPVYFDLIPDMIIKDKVSLELYNEELVMGLQCLNKNSDVVVPALINKLGRIKKFLISKNIVNFEKIINIDELNITDVFTVGQNCRSIVRSINSVLRKNKISIPDFFCVDPESNAPDDSIVMLRTLVAQYKKTLKLFAQ